MTLTLDCYKLNCAPCSVKPPTGGFFFFLVTQGPDISFDWEASTSEESAPKELPLQGTQGWPRDQIESGHLPHGGSLGLRDLG